MSRIRGPRKLTGNPRSGTLAAWAQGSFIKSVQRGTLSFANAPTGTQTITLVDPTHSELRMLGMTQSSAAVTNPDQFIARLALTNGTTITGTMSGTNNSNTITISWEVIEYMPGVIRSVQRGTVTEGTPATVNAVNMSKASLRTLGYVWATSTAAFDASVPVYLSLASATSITCTNGKPVANPVASYELIEWW